MNILPEDNVNIIGSNTEKIIGFIESHGKRFMFANGRNKIVSHCTLIARPIEDMTVKETYYVYFGDEQPEDNSLSEGGAEILQSDISERVEKGFLDYATYPFDQKAFEDGTIKTVIKNEEK